MSTLSFLATQYGRRSDRKRDYEPLVRKKDLLSNSTPLPWDEAVAKLTR